MNFNFTKVRLEDVIDLVIDHRGKTPKKLGSDFCKIGVPVLSAKHVKTDQLVNMDEVRFISADIYKKWMREETQAGDVLLTSEAPLGEVYVLPNDTKYVLGQRLFGLRPKIGILHPQYLAAWLLTPEGKTTLQGRASGTTAQGIKQSELLKIEINLPNYNTQSFIGSVRECINKKIELNCQTNQTLEQVAQTIFKSWFIDFDPVHAKAKGQKPLGMDDETAALFPDSFEESKLGLIPKGWEIKSLDQIADFLNGLALQKFPAKNGEAFLPAIKIAELRRGITNQADKISTEVPKEYIVDNGDILFSWSGSLTHLVWTHGKGALNQHLFKVIPKNYPKWFVFYWLDKHMSSFQEIAASKATTMGHIQRHHLKEAFVVVPDKILLQKLSKIIEPIFKKTTSINLESRLLITTRDKLLPKLISGELALNSELL